MSVFRVERTRDYTVMSNHHLKNKKLSLKAKGLMSLILSLPEEWDYTLKGLSYISLEKIDAVRSAIIELEQAGYIIRRRIRDGGGKLRGTEYIIHEEPIVDEVIDGEGDMQEPMRVKPTLENPTQVNPTQERPILDKPIQLNINNKSNNQELNIYEENTHSNLFSGVDERAPSASVKDRMDRIKQYEQMIKKNIEYDFISKRFDKSRIDEIVAIMVETVCTTKDVVRVAGNDFPSELVKSQLLKIDSTHIEFVLDCLNENTSKIHNIKQYLLTTLFNAPNTINSYYTACVNHDMRHYCQV